MQFDESQLIYLMDYQNAAVLHEDDGSFDSYKLTSGHHYRVNGTAQRASAATWTPTAAQHLENFVAKS